MKGSNNAKELGPVAPFHQLENPRPAVSLGVFMRVTRQEFTNIPSWQHLRHI
jgi:hypothetical protein